MRILFDARRSVHRPTGIGRVIDGLLNALVEQDSQNQYLVLFGEKNPLKGVQAANFEVRQLDLGLNSLAVNLVMPYLASSWHADVAYFPFWLMPLIMPCPSVVAVHDLIFSNYPHYLSLFRRQVYKQYTTLTVRAARRIQTLSAHGQRELAHFFRVPACRVDVIPPDADSKCIQRHLTPSELERLKAKGLSRPFALYVGNHKPHKNLERLLKAYQLIASQIETELVMAGAKASYEDSYAFPYLDLVQELSIQDRVRFIGEIDDQELCVLYNAARFLLFPSLYEGFGLPPLEAMRCGTPVACSNTTSLPEVVGDAALTFDPLDTRRIADAMLRLDESAELREELSRRGLERVKLFSWRESARKWLASIERAARGK